MMAFKKQKMGRALGGRLERLPTEALEGSRCTFCLLLVVVVVVAVVVP